MNNRDTKLGGGKSLASLKPNEEEALFALCQEDALERQSCILEINRPRDQIILMETRSASQRPHAELFRPPTPIRGFRLRLPYLHEHAEHPDVPRVKISHRLESMRTPNERFRVPSPCIACRNPEENPEVPDRLVVAVHPGRPQDLREQRHSLRIRPKSILQLSA